MKDSDGQGVESALPGGLCVSHMEANTEHIRSYLTIEACDVKGASESLKPEAR